MLDDEFKQKGWTAIGEMSVYEKGDWNVYFDTSNWMIVGTKNNPGLFVVPVPEAYASGWTVNLIEHLCQMEDERYRLREALERIQDNASDQVVRSIAEEALAQCYHRWYVYGDMPEVPPGKVYCPICKQTQIDDVTHLPPVHKQ